MKKYLGIIILAVIIVALVVVAIVFDDSESNYLKDTTLTEVIDMMDDEKSFILYINQSDCEHCKQFTPNFISVLRETDLVGYSLNLSNLSEEDMDLYESTFDVDGTPTVLFYTEGNESLIRLEGEQTKAKIKSKIEAAGFIE